MAKLARYLFRSASVIRSDLPRISPCIRWSVEAKTVPDYDHDQTTSLPFSLSSSSTLRAFSSLRTSLRPFSTHEGADSFTDAFFCLFDRAVTRKTCVSVPEHVRANLSPDEKVTVHVDARWINELEVQAGVTCRTTYGRVLFASVWVVAVARLLPGLKNDLVEDPPVAELVGVLCGLRCVVENGLVRYDMCTDNTIVHKFLTNSKKNNYRQQVYRFLATASKKVLLDQGGSESVFWVPRLSNNVVDYLSNLNLAELEYLLDENSNAVRSFVRLVMTDMVNFSAPTPKALEGKLLLGRGFQYDVEFVCSLIGGN